MIAFYFVIITGILSIAWVSIVSQAIDVTTTVPRHVDNILKKTNITNVRKNLNHTRRILWGTEANEKRPYMVYLKLAASNPKFQQYRRWLCGGVIIHEEYILTSAACIEDVKHFYVVAGTNKYDERDDRFTNLCIKNGARKAIWKCIPRNYIFDGHENDNVRWMNNDIAIVKVDEEFDFTRKARGCDYIPKPVCYNNESSRLEENNPTVLTSVAGWGSTKSYGDTSKDGTQNLMEARVRIMDKKTCKRRWGRKYYNIIESYMICTEDILQDPSPQCLEKYVECTEVFEETSEEGRRTFDPSKMFVHSAYHNISDLHNGTRKQNVFISTGGFCENDHGGPLVYGEGPKSVVLGIISACLVREATNDCYGPFLYTSVYKNRALITCAIYKDTSHCEKIFRSHETHVEEHISWINHPDGPAKNELNNSTTTDTTLNDTVANKANQVKENM